MRIYKYLLIIALLNVFSLILYSQNSKRIVSFVPSVTRMINILQMGKNIVACTNYCKPDNNKAVIIGSTIDVNLEKLILLKPDIVFAGYYNKPSTIEAIKKYGIKVVLISNPVSYNEICLQLKEVASYIGKQKIADSIINLQKERLAIISRRIKWKNTPSIFFEIGTKPLYTVTQNTFMNDYINYLKCKNIFCDLKNGAVSRESVLSKNPDIIIITTMGITGYLEKREWERYKALKAAKNNSIYVIDSDKTCSPCPIAFVDMFEVLVNMCNNISL